ncbi:MATE family efflux transporter [Amaricoccus solimangrovi]|nr:MATE family efflux transporter [Amaricoccus solimangrovi]
MAEIDLSDPRLGRLIWRLGLPAMAGLSLNAAHQVADAFFVGRLGAEALAVLALLAPVGGLTVALGVGLGTGAASALARALGAGEPTEARRVAGTALAAGGAVALLALATLLASRDAALALLAMPDALTGAARGYYPVLALTLGLGTVQIVCDFVAIGRGDSRFSLGTLALCFGLNILLDPVFIFALGLGLPGAAWATLTAQLVTLAVWAGYFRAPARRPLRGSPALLARILRVGLPEAGSVAITTFGMMALLRLAAGIGGEAALAGFGIALRLVLVVTLPLEGFAIGAQPVLAHAFGAGQPERAGRALRRLVLVACGVSGTLALGFALSAERLAGLMSRDPAVIAAASAALLCLAPALPAMALRVIAQICLQAMARARMAAVLGLAPMGWLLWPVLGLTLPRLGVTALPLSITLAALGAALLAGAVLRRAAFPPAPVGAFG